VSYDIARELFAQINPAFAAAWKARTGQDIKVDQSHGGSSRQARAVLEGLQADVITFNQVLDIQVLHDRGKLIPADWQKRFPHDSSPYYSLPAFLVRKGNPKGIKDWGDLTRDGLQVLFPNPKTSGNARYTYLAAYASALEQNGGDAAKAEASVKKLPSQRARVRHRRARGHDDLRRARDRRRADLVRGRGERDPARVRADKFDVVTPPLSIEADFPVTLVDAVADKRGSREVATAYLEFLYSPEGQDILARNFNRVRDPEVAARHRALFPDVRLVTVDQVFGGWTQANKVHFAEGGVLDRVLGGR
jgi:sulfate transport system substrate-binding protein